MSLRSSFGEGIVTKDNPVKDVARTQTIKILRRLESDGMRQDRIIHFLQDAELYKFIFKNANLSRINLQGADLRWANLQGAKLREANLQGANLWQANLQGANLIIANLQKAYLMGTEENLTPKQIKLACFWEEAIYRSKYDFKKEIYVVIEPDNTNYIEELKQNKSSDSRRPPDCSKWEKE